MRRSSWDRPRYRLALKADVVLAVQLASRHRTPRLAAVLAAVLVVLLRLLSTPAGATAPHAAVLLVAGTLSAAAASRAVSPGAAIVACRRAAPSWWIPPVGRLAGVLTVVLAAVGVAIAALYLPQRTAAAARLLVAAAWYSAAVVGLTLALTPLVGSSAAATLGLLTAWFGAVPPSALAASLSGWQVLKTSALLAWHLLPLPWRADRLFMQGGAADAGFFAVWILLTLVATAWTLERAGNPAPAAASS